MPVRSLSAAILYSLHFSNTAECFFASLFETSRTTTTKNLLSRSLDFKACTYQTGIYIKGCGKQLAWPFYLQSAKHPRTNRSALRLNLNKATPSSSFTSCTVCSFEKKPATKILEAKTSRGPRCFRMYINLFTVFSHRLPRKFT